MTRDDVRAGDPPEHEKAERGAAPDDARQSDSGPGGRDPGSLARALKEKARGLGFDTVGIAGTEPSDHEAFYRAWLDEGYHGDMEYLARDDAVERRGDPRKTLESVRSAVVVTQSYAVEDPPGIPDDPSKGVIARYARGRDYHKVVKPRLWKLFEWVRGEVGREVAGYVTTDTGPVFERELARRAGLGWFGRNTMLIDPRRGSYFFLGVLLLEVELPPDEPFSEDRCGTCSRCLEACPTDALLGRNEDGAPVMDARRCISYLTIEHRGPIPEKLRPLMGNRVFGCDICQEVCPFNERFAEVSAEPGYAARGPGELPFGVEALPGERAVAVGEGVSGETRGDRDGSVGAEARDDVSSETSGVGYPAHPGTHAPSLVELMRMTREEWDAFSRGSAIRRVGYAGFKRNVAVAMGNWLAGLEDEPPEEAVAVLRDAMKGESELVQEHAAWALDQAAA